MGAKVVGGMGAWTALGRVLDAQRAVARAGRAVARPWLFQSRGEPPRSALFWFYRSVFDRSPFFGAGFSLLHRSGTSASARSADQVHRAAAADNSRMFCALSLGRLSIAMDARGTTDWTGDHRLRLRDVSFRSPTFRCAFPVSFPSGSRLMHSYEALGSFFRADCWRVACVCRGHFGWSGRLPGSVGRSLVSDMDHLG